MRTTLLSIALLVFSYAEGQTTLIPDINFELALISLGFDSGTPDGAVPTSNISGVPVLYVEVSNISDLTGIEDFTSLIELQCYSNNLSFLDLSQNINLSILECHNNQLTSLDLSNNLNLTFVNCNSNQLTSLDVSQNLALQGLLCSVNQLSSLDVSHNLNLSGLICRNNQLKCLNVKNGNNHNFYEFKSRVNPNLTCIEVDNVEWSTTNWTVGSLNIEAYQSFSTDCGDSCELETDVCDYLKMPNVFTPNGDNLNDIFIPRESEGINEWTMTIINRWGQVLFKSNDKVIGWNGNNKSVECLDGVYYWKVNFTDFANRACQSHGVLTLIRNK